MHRSALTFLSVLAACRTPGEAPPAEPTSPPAAAEPAEPDNPDADPAPTTTPAPMPTPTHVLPLREPVPLDSQNALRVQDVIIESIEPSPEDPEAYPAGSGIDVTVVMQRGSYEVRAELSLLSEGYTSQPVGWLEDYRVTLLDVAEPHRAPEVSLVVERVTDHDTDEPPQMLRLTKDQPSPLRDGTVLTLRGHGHKRTSPGQRSPLMIAVRWEVPGQPAVDQDTSIGPSEDDDRWSWRDLVVTVGEYDYGDWMDVTIVRRQLQRVEAPSSEPSP